MNSPEHKREINKWAKMDRQRKAQERQGLPQDNDLMAKLILGDDVLARTVPTWHRHYPPTIADAVRTALRAGVDIPTDVR